MEPALSARTVFLPHPAFPAMDTLTRASSPALDAILGQTFKVLDDGFVRVVDYMGNDTSIVQAARVSYGDGTKKSSRPPASPTATAPRRAPTTSTSSAT